jgi:hypothetical protein
MLWCSLSCFSLPDVSGKEPRRTYIKYKK